jgi:hypothetical protein
VLREHVDIKQGHVQQSNFYDYQLTGVRLRELPFSPERVRRALA